MLGLSPDTAPGTRAQPWVPRDSGVLGAASHSRGPRLRTGPHRAPCAPGSRSRGERWASVGGRAPPMDRSHNAGPDAPPCLQSPQIPAADGGHLAPTRKHYSLQATASGSHRLLPGSGRQTAQEDFRSLSRHLAVRRRPHRRSSALERSGGLQKGSSGFWRQSGRATRKGSTGGIFPPSLGTNENYYYYFWRRFN